MKIVTFDIPIDEAGNPAPFLFNGVAVRNLPHIYGDELLHQAFQHHRKLLSLARRMETFDLDADPRRYRGEPLDGKTLLIWRLGGFGDVLFITPLVRKLKTLYPTATIEFAVGVEYACALDGNPDVMRSWSIPIPVAALDKVDYILNFSNTIERSKDPSVHAIDVFAGHAGITLAGEEKSIVYSPSPARVASVRNQIAEKYGVRWDIPAVAIQVAASSHVRTYPEHLQAEVIRKIVKSGCQVLVMGMKGQFPKLAKQGGVFDLCGAFSDMADAVAALANCDALVAPDSSLTHFAGAMSIPTVALYGPFPGAVRTAYYPSCTTLEVDRSRWTCAPCFTHGHKPCPKAVALKQTWSPCFQSIQPVDIAAAVKEIIAKSVAKSA